MSHYRVIALLGEGGMGQVYKALDHRLDRTVAIKVLPPAATRDPDAARRLLREARLASSLNHPNIVTIYAVERAGDLDFIVMEYVEGETLHARLRRGPLDLGELLELGIQASRGIAAAHEVGLIHRDIKSSNIARTRRGQVKVLDFGLAKMVVAPPSDRLGSTTVIESTAEGTVRGTIPYMSPEQTRGEPLDGRSDIFSLGTVLYECATGQLPFTGPNALAVIHQIGSVEPRPPSAVRSDLPAELDLILARVLAKDLAHRFATGDELAAAFENLTARHAQTFAPLLASAPASSTGLQNLPIALTRFIGRGREISEVKRLLSSSRLVTLTGAGGCGKSRLALKVAEDCLARCPDGVWLVELAALSEPSLVPQALASVLDLREEPGRPLIETLGDHLISKSILFILDNCEHLTAACASVAQALLHTCPGLTILATSREGLGIPGERIWRIPSLTTPSERHVAEVSSDETLEFESVQLFMDRARDVNPNFRAGARSIAAIAQICRRLDGIPLAIELAAARIKAITPEKILERLEDRFQLLTGGGRTTLPRQQTLRATVDWSYDLLSPAERELFQRLSVFAGGLSLNAAETVCSDGHIDAGAVLDLISHLVDKSLLVPDEGPEGVKRYRLLESIRAYGLDRLREAGDEIRFRERHVQYFLHLAREAEQQLQGPNQGAWLDRLDEEHDNLRQGIQWSLAHAEPSIGLEICSLLWRFWWVRGNWSEGRKRLEEALAHEAAGASSQLRAKALHGAAVLARGQGSYESAEDYLDRGLAIARELGDVRATATIVHELGNIANERADFGSARSLYEESLSAWRGLKDKRGMSSALHNLGVVAQAQGDYPIAQKLYSESLEIQRELGNRAWEAAGLNGLGSVALQLGDLDGARRYSEMSLAIQRDLGDRWGTAFSLRELGSVAERQGDYAAARSLLLESLSIVRDLGDKESTAEAMERLASLAAVQGQPARAHRLAGASASLRREIGSPLTPSDQAALEARLADAMREIGDEPAARAYAEGSAFTLDQAVEYARRADE